MEIAICDDNPLFLDELKEMLSALQTADNVFLFSNLDSFFFSTEGGMRYDVVFMDIEWGKKAGGMDAAAELYKQCPETKVIYVTGRVEWYSQQIFLNRANLSGYLTKPVDPELLRANLQKVADALQYAEQPSLVLQQKGAPVSIPLREIYFIESDGHTVTVHAGSEPVSAYERLGNIIRSLPMGFFQCHKSFIVNMSHIRRFQPGEVLLKNGAKVPVSRSKYNETKEAYFKFVGQAF